MLPGINIFLCGSQGAREKMEDSSQKIGFFNVHRKTSLSLSHTHTLTLCSSTHALCVCFLSSLVQARSTVIALHSIGPMSSAKQGVVGIRVVRLLLQMDRWGKSASCGQSQMVNGTCTLVKFGVNLLSSAQPTYPHKLMKVQP